MTERAESSALLKGINRHETEALQRLIRLGRSRAAALYLLALRRVVDVSTGVVGDGRPLTAAWMTTRTGRKASPKTLEALVAELEQARLLSRLPSPPGRFRFYLPLVNRSASRQREARVVS